MDMKGRFDLHMHTYRCDGQNTAEEMILAAIDLGLDTVGISGHSYTEHDTSYCMSPEDTEEYVRELHELRNKYADRINVLIGIERDYYSDISTEPFDYVIGSLHYLNDRGWWTDVDDTPYKLRDFANRRTGGDMMSLAEMYYGTVGKIVSATDCDIIGHFDLITKFNERYRLAPDGSVEDTLDDVVFGGSTPLFDTQDQRYIAAWQNAVDKIFEDCSKRGNRLFDTDGMPVFEINTGAISRGYRTMPYPARDQIEYIRSKGGLFILSSDSHSAENLCHDFDRFEDML